VMSIKNAPTNVTTSIACGAGPKRRVKRSMLAMALGVMPSSNPV
jgi:hypothetical protein